MNGSVAQMFGRIAKVYDLLNHVLSLGIDRNWRRQLAALVPGDSARILDLAAGTLDVSLSLHKIAPKALILAMDFCQPMLVSGMAKLTTPALKRAILPCAGDALELPLPDNCMDAVTMAFGIRNISTRMDAFTEMRRVVRAGGSVCILEFGSANEKILYGLYNFYLARILPRIGSLLAKDKSAYEYLARTIKEFPSAPALAAELEAAGFANVRYRKLSGGIVCLHWAEKLS